MDNSEPTIEVVELKKFEKIDHRFEKINYICKKFFEMEIFSRISSLFSKSLHWFQRMIIIVMFGMILGTFITLGVVQWLVDGAINVQRGLYQGTIYEIMESSVRRKISSPNTFFPQVFQSQKSPELKTDVKSEPDPLPPVKDKQKKGK